MPGMPWHRSPIAMTQKQSKLLLALGFPILMLLGRIKWNWAHGVSSVKLVHMDMFMPWLNEVAPDWLHVSSCTRKCPVPCLVLSAMQCQIFKNISLKSFWKIWETFPKVGWHTVLKEQIGILPTRTLTAWISSVANQPSLHPIVQFWESHSDLVSNLPQKTLTNLTSMMMSVSVEIGRQFVHPSMKLPFQSNWPSWCKVMLGWKRCNLRWCPDSWLGSWLGLTLNVSLFIPITVAKEILRDHQEPRKARLELCVGSLGNASAVKSINMSDFSAGKCWQKVLIHKESKSSISNQGSEILLYISSLGFWMIVSLQSPVPGVAFVRQCSTC